MDEWGRSCRCYRQNRNTKLPSWDRRLVGRELIYITTNRKRITKRYATESNNSFSAEHTAVSFNDLSDYRKYNNQRSRGSLKGSLKTAFGCKMKIVDNYMLVGAPLVDARYMYDSPIQQSIAAPRGAVYVFHYVNKQWNFVGSVYGGGYTAANVAGQYKCSYETLLFGLELDYDATTNTLAVSEPGSRRVYTFYCDQYSIHRTNSYLKKGVGFGRIINVCAGSIE